MNGAAHIARARADVTVRWHPLALVALAFSAWVYYPITRVFFYADDFFHLSRITSVPALTFVLTPFAGHNLVVRNLAFLVSWHLFGLHAAPWYWTVLLTHLLNVWLLFGVLGALTASVPLACLGATIWGTCPLGVGALAWYSVYGQVLAGTALLIVLDQLSRLAATGAPVPRRTACLWYVLLLAGTTCSESASAWRSSFRSCSSSCFPRHGGNGVCGWPTWRFPSSRWRVTSRSNGSPRCSSRCP